MRLARLDLTRYGHFTDCSLALPAPAPGAPDLHVIYGPNEAGKSTIYSAWLDLLFGFPHKTPYSFVHDNRSLRIGAVLDDTQGTQHGFVRLKGNTATLIDPASGRPLPEVALGGLLSGLDRISYQTMFSLDDDTLERGGEAILASEGDLGSLLFQASAGLSDLTVTLEQLRQSAQDWFSPGKRKHALTEHKRALKQIDDTRREQDMQAGEWARLIATRDTAQAAYERIHSTHTATRTALAGIERDLSALPLYRRLLADLRAFAEQPTPQDLPAEWTDKLPEWRTRADRLAALIPVAAAGLERLRSTRAALPHDALAEALVHRLDVLDAVAGAVTKSHHDLARRRSETSDVDAQIDALHAALGAARPSARDCILPEALGQRLREMIEAEGRIILARSTAEAELARAQAELEVATEAVGTAPAPDPLAVDTLRALLPALRAEDPARRAREAVEAHMTAQSERVRAQARLAPWQGDIATLRELTVPSMARLQAIEQVLKQTGDACARTAEAALAARDRVTQGLAALNARSAKTPDPEALRDARRARGESWSAHKRSLNATTAETFEVAMALDDALTDARIQAAGHIEARAAIAVDTARAEQAETAHDAARQAHAANQAELAQLAESLGCDLSITAADLAAWCAMRDTTLAAEAGEQAAFRRADDARARFAQAQATLVAALSRLGAPDDDKPGFNAPGFDALIAQAEARLTVSTRAEASKSTLIKARRAVQTRRDAHDAANRAQSDWTGDWQSLCAQTWAGPEVTTAIMRATLTTLDRLAPLVIRADGLARQIAGIEEDTAKFAEQIKALADAMGDKPDGQPAIAEGDPLARWGLLRERLRMAQERQRQRADLDIQIDEALAGHDDLLAQQAQLHSETAEIRAHFNLDDLAAIEVLVSANARARDLAHAIATARDDLAAQLGHDHPDDALTQLSQVDETAHRAQAATLRTALELEDAAQREAHSVLSRAEAACDAVGHDAAAAQAAEARQTLLLQIADEAQAHMARIGGIMALERALALYRDRHRSGMLTKAGHAFARLTDGAYRGLQTTPEGGRDLLIAMTADGRSKPVDTLSKGTRFQLYLALRIAGYLEFAAARAIVPFIADDIMETFDDTRAHASFAALAEMAQHGQVIYLTHHAHLCDIARAACPSVQIHDLLKLRENACADICADTDAETGPRA